MNTLDILHALKERPEIGKYFYGVFPSDFLPLNVKLPAFLICNTEPSSKRGSHWCAIYINKAGESEIFNSFGSLQPIQKEFRQFLQKNSPRGYTVSNTKRLQSDYSTNCGNYCCVYLYYKACKKTMWKFLSQFSEKRLSENDTKVMKMYTKLFKTKPSQYNSTQFGGLMCNQNCKARRNKK